MGESFSGLDHLFEVVPKTEPVSFELESLQRLLAAETLYHGDLSNLIYEIANLEKLSKEWRTVFELAYEKIPLNKRIYARDAMMYLYCAFEDYKAAAKFLPLKPYTPWEITVARWVTERKSWPAHGSSPPPDPAAHVANLLASLEEEQRKRFGKAASPEAANLGEN